MFKVGEYIVYKKNTCYIKNIKTNESNDKYYVLMPIDDDSLIIDVPVENNLGDIRNLISKKEVEEIINSISNIYAVDEENDKLLEPIYRRLLSSGQHDDLIKIIKTTYLRNEKRLNNGKKISEKDDNYFKKAERLLYNEFSIVLNLSYDEVKNYVVKRVKNNIANNK